MYASNQLSDPNEVDNENSENPVIEQACVPDVVSNTAQRAYLRKEIGVKDTDPIHFPLSMPSMQKQPLSERDISLHIERMVFPTLFPTGSASFHNSRMRTVGLNNYHAHLMRYKDGRFARHPTFRYWALNTQLRHQADSTARYLTRLKRDELPDIEELQEMVNDPNSHLEDIIFRKAASLRGTRPYWVAASSELEAMVKDLNGQTLFFTASAADLQWADLYKHMPEAGRRKDLSEKERNKLNSRLLQENPHITAEYLDRRWRLFMETVLMPKFGVLDYWYRYEWQSRGSGHVHGFLWVDTPSFEQEEAYLAHWGPLVTAMNPAGGLPPASVHPCSKPIHLRANDVRGLAELLNRVERHTKCTRAYCLRQVKGSKTQRCRFHFPRPLQDSPTVSNALNPKWLTYNPARNDPLMGNYNPAYIMGWLANVDISPCTDQRAVLGYIAKYCTKSETSSQSYKDLLKALFDTVSSSSENPLLSLVSKIMNKLISERDWSAQEVCHHLLDRNLKACTRGFTNIDVRPLDMQSRVMSKLTSESTVLSKTFLEKYCARQTDQAHWTLIHVARYCEWKKGVFTERARAKPKIVKIYPQYSSDLEGRDYEDFCRAKMMLHHPFQNPLLMDLLQDGSGITFNTWREAYAYCKEYHSDHEPDPLGATTDMMDEESDTESLSQDKNLKEEEVRHEELLLLRHPRRDGTTVNDDIDFGRRNIDTQYNWLQAKTYPVDVDALVNHIDTQKGMAVKPSGPRTLEEAGDISILNTEQRQLFDLVVNHYLNSDPDQLLLHVDGAAGTGKSKCIDLISAHMAYHAADLAIRRGEPVDECDPVVRAAPTGVAAYNIAGSTLHSLLRLPVNQPFVNLNQDSLGKLQRDFRHVKLLIVDEKSMIGLNFLLRIDSRLRSILAQPDRPFGGINVLLCGDFAQLSPVGDAALYAKVTKNFSVQKLAAKKLYEAFDKTIVLKQIMRQQGKTESARQFRDTLSQLRDGPISPENWQFLLTRAKDYLPAGIWQEFDRALRLYFRNEEVREYNWTRLRELGSPVMKIEAKNVGKGAKDASLEDAGRLDQELLLSRGSRVMLTWNRWTSEGLVNGAMGTLYDLIWDEGVQDPFTTMPAITLVEMDDYHGPGSINIDGVHVVPIAPTYHQWVIDGVVCTRTQFPFTLAFAITVHKCQGLTLPKVVLKFSRKDDTTGQSYVALSRVRAIENVVFDSGFSYDRFPKKPSVGAQGRMNDAANRQLVPAISDSALASCILQGASSSVSSPCINPISLNSSPTENELRGRLFQAELNNVSCTDAVLKYESLSLASVLGVPITTIDRFRASLNRSEEIARIIGQYPIVRFRNGTFQHSEIVTRQHGMFDVNLWVLCTFLHKEWLCSSAIDGAMFSHIRDADYGTQYLSIPTGQYMLDNLRQKIPVTHGLFLEPLTERIVIPLNVRNSHWCVAMAECVNQCRIVTVYNSLPSIDASELNRDLPLLVDCIVDKNPLSLWTNSSWSSQQVIFASTAIQRDGYNCGVHTIRNAIALTKR